MTAMMVGFISESDQVQCHKGPLILPTFIFSSKSVGVSAFQQGQIMGHCWFSDQTCLAVSLKQDMLAGARRSK